jgi:hypothetical protein
MMMSVREVYGGSFFGVNCMECSTFTVSFLCYGCVLNVTLEGSTVFYAGQHMDLLIFLGSVIVIISLYEY